MLGKWERLTLLLGSTALTLPSLARAIVAESGLASTYGDAASVAPAASPTDFFLGPAPGSDMCANAAPSNGLGSADATKRAELEQQLADARAEAERWRILHAQLYSFCVDCVIPAKEQDSQIVQHNT